MKRRESFLIQMEILAALYDSPLPPTRLALICKLHEGRLESYLEPLVERGLVREVSVGDRRFFYLNQTGLELYRDWLEVWRRLRMD